MPNPLFPLLLLLLALPSSHANDVARGLAFHEAGRFHDAVVALRRATAVITPPPPPPSALKQKKTSSSSSSARPQKKRKRKKKRPEAGIEHRRLRDGLAFLFLGSALRDGGWPQEALPEYAMAMRHFEAAQRALAEVGAADLGEALRSAHVDALVGEALAHEGLVPPALAAALASAETAVAVAKGQGTATKPNKKTKKKKKNKMDPSPMFNAREILGRVLHRLARHEEAAKQWRRAVSLSPDPQSRRARVACAAAATGSSDVKPSPCRIAPEKGGPAQLLAASSSSSNADDDSDPRAKDGRKRTEKGVRLYEARDVVSADEAAALVAIFDRVADAHARRGREVCVPATMPHAEANKLPLWRLANSSSSSSNNNNRKHASSRGKRCAVLPSAAWLDTTPHDAQAFQAPHSSSVFVHREDEALVDEIEDRLCRIFGLEPSHAFSSQLLKYTGGGAGYGNHTDCQASTQGMLHDRVITVLVYLTSTAPAGETVFPRLGVRVAPELGKAIAFESTGRFGFCHPSALHLGAPTPAGTQKYVLQKWFARVPMSTAAKRQAVAESLMSRGGGGTSTRNNNEADDEDKKQQQHQQQQQQQQAVRMSCDKSGSCREYLPYVEGKRVGATHYDDTDGEL